MPTSMDKPPAIYTAYGNVHKTIAFFSSEVKSGTFGTISELNNGYTFNKTSNKSYASYLLSSTFESLNFTVRTRSISSVIIKLQFNNSEFLSIETDSGGHLQLRHKDGYVRAGGFHKINDAIERHVHVNLAAVHVNGTSFDVTLTPFLVRTVFVGGLPETGDEGSSAHEQFRGCIRDVRLNEQQLLFFNQTEDGLNSTQVNIAEGCHGEKVCPTVLSTYCMYNYASFNVHFCSASSIKRGHNPPGKHIRM